MIPRLDIQFPFCRQWQYWFGKLYEPKQGEYLLNHARSGIVLVLCASLPNGGRVGVVVYNCHTVANAVVNAGCTPVFVDVTDELKINVDALPADLDAIVVTNLFGIRNDIMAIRKRCPKAIIIVDNAHGYGLPAEGDFTIYSINQGKFPALGCGGILCVNIKENNNKENTACAEENIKENDSKSKTNNPAIDEMYAALPSYGFMGQVQLFCSMLVKAIAYSRCMYWLTMKVKGMRELGSERIREKVVMKRMAAGVRRLYQAWLPSAASEIAKQKRNAESIINLKSEIINSQYIIGSNAFMVIVRTEAPAALKAEFTRRGIETETHFKHCIEWAKQFGYVEGSCPCAEELTTKLLMIPTYTKI